MDYRDIIESRYNREAWQQLLHDIFRSKVSFWREPSAVHASNRLAKKALNLGKISLADGESIAIYEIELTDNVDIERNRRGIRDMLTTDWRNMGYAGAFMFCYRQNESVLRFSYVSESWSFADDGTYKKDSTDTRRFTYLLGEGHRSRTAIQQFEGLKKSNLSLKDLTKAFSVDAVSDMFFDDYKQQYEDIIAFITGKRMVKVSNKWEERVVGEPNETIFSEFRVFSDTEKAIRDYVKKLMGRLVFLQFLQKKGWLGVPVNSKWGDGDPEFIQHLFEKTNDKDNFVDNVLEPLFNDINSEREGDIASSAVGKDIRVPYLNGGLFEPDAADAVDFSLPAKYMKSMLDFFASYNFTIDENDPDDAEMGVDPEMLGRIFENLLEDNKDKGAFYTPKEIVGYMCRESLIAYLQTDIEKEEQKEAIRQFVTTHQFAEHLPGDTLEMLKNVKICDPAIGSGAFPMGLLKELYLCRATLEGFDQKKAAEIKKHIIQQNIYGVDIERGAVDTARLRFWLALIVDEETPEALPNLDFKIMQGNSLLESFHGIDLSNILGAQANNQLRIIFDDESCAQEILLKSLRDFYGCSDATLKKQLRTRINAQLRDLIRTRITKGEIQNEIDSLTAQNDKFFLWHTWFSDVFSNGGFDIVIGNPPYVQLQNNAGELAKIYEDCGYESFARTGDIYCLFYERGWQLLKNNGHLCFITSNKWMRAGYGEKTRGFFAKKTDPMLLIDFAGVKIFESATVDTNILLFSKTKNKHHTVCAVTNKQNKESVNNLSVFVQQQHSINDFSSSDSWVILSEIELSIKRKIEAAGTPLKDWDIQIYRGVLTGYNDAFIISTEKRDEILANCQSEEERAKTEELIRPILRGRDIKRYGYDWAGLWLINTHNGVKGVMPRIDIEEYPAVKQHLDKYWNKISKRADKGDTPYNLRNCAYVDDFSKPKIVWAELARTGNAFTTDFDCKTVGNTGYI
ncbi:MAG: Eco57I restriction-modification methylase domain-containing protein, partial [Muribaculaceae bacterium]|nr:Eco57I restriction-modification methylase domain-containing protein [Muribaculaceae bacterium]